MDRAWESQAKTAQVRLGAASGLTVSAQIPWTAPRTPQTPPRSPNELASKSPFPPRTLRLLRSSEAKSKGLHLLTMRARAPAGRSVPEGHGASAELSRAPGICALLATPERTQHSLRPPPQVTGACSSFHPCPPPGSPLPSLTLSPGTLWRWWLSLFSPSSGPQPQEARHKAMSLL